MTLTDPVSQADDVVTLIRTAKGDDLAFVADSWRRSYSDARTARSPDLGEYIRCERHVVEAALARSQVAVLYPEDCEEQILGWVCWCGPVLHWTYVKEPFRGRGFAKRLYAHAMGEASQIWASHSAEGLRGGAAFSAWVRGRARLTYNPALIFMEKR